MRKEKNDAKRLFKAGIFCLLICLILPGYTFSQEPFYKGKTIKLVSGRKPGGSGDMRVRGLLPFLKKHIPGNPNLVMRYMPGGGGRKTSNYIYKVARPDGLTIGNVGSGLVSNGILGASGVKYDVDKLVYLGSANSKSSYVFFTRSELGLNTLEKLRAHSGLRIGSQSVGHDIYVNARLQAWFLGLKEPKFITGYSGPEMDIALEKGEIDGRSQIPDNVVNRNPEWIEKKFLNYHAIFEFPKGFRFRHPVFDPVPALQDFIKSDMEKKVVTMFVNFRLVGSPWVMHPDTPLEQVKILKAAFTKAMTDPEFPQYYKKMVWFNPEPVLPDEQVKLVREIPRDKDTIKVFKKIAGPGPLPPR